MIVLLAILALLNGVVSIAMEKKVEQEYFYTSVSAGPEYIVGTLPSRRLYVKNSTKYPFLVSLKSSGYFSKVKELVIQKDNWVSVGYIGELETLSIGSKTLSKEEIEKKLFGFNEISYDLILGVTDITEPFQEQNIKKFQISRPDLEQYTGSLFVRNHTNYRAPISFKTKSATIRQTFSPYQSPERLESLSKIEPIIEIGRRSFRWTDIITPFFDGKNQDLIVNLGTAYSCWKMSGQWQKKGTLEQIEIQETEEQGVLTITNNTNPAIAIQLSYENNGIKQRRILRTYGDRVQLKRSEITTPITVASYGQYISKLTEAIPVRPLVIPRTSEVGDAQGNIALDIEIRLTGLKCVKTIKTLEPFKLPATMNPMDAFSIASNADEGAVARYILQLPEKYTKDEVVNAYYEILERYPQIAEEGRAQEITKKIRKKIAESAKFLLARLGLNWFDVMGKDKLQPAPVDRFFRLNDVQRGGRLPVEISKEIVRFCGANNLVTLEAQSFFAKNYLFNANKLAAVYREEGSVKLLRVASGTELWSGRDSKYYEFSSDGNQLLVKNKDGLVTLVQVATGKELWTGKDASSYLFMLDSNVLAVSKDAGLFKRFKEYSLQGIPSCKAPIKFIEVETGRVLLTLGDNVTYQFHPDNKFVFVCDHDGKATLLQLDTGEEVWSKKDIKKFCSSFDGKILFLYSEDMMKALQIDTGEELWSIKDSLHYCLVPKSKILMLMSDNGVVKGLQVDTGRELWSKEKLSKPEISSDGKLLIAYFPGDCVTALQIETGVELVSISNVKLSTLSPNNKLLLVQFNDVKNDDKALVLFHLYTGKKLWLPKKAGCEYSFSPDGNALFSYSSDGVITCFQVDTGKMLWATKEDPLALKISLDGKLVLIHNNNGCVVALQRDTGVEFWSKKEVRQLEFDGLSKIVVEFKDSPGKKVQLDVATGKEIPVSDTGARHTDKVSTRFLIKDLTITQALYLQELYCALKNSTPWNQTMHAGTFESLSQYLRFLITQKMRNLKALKLKESVFQE